MSGHHYHRALSVAAIKSLIEVGLLSFGRDSGGRACTLDIDDNKWKLRHYSQSESLALEGKSRTGSSGYRQIACEGRTYCCTYARNLVFSL